MPLHAYRLLEDAWTGGVADWCRAAPAWVLRGGRAWLLAANDGQARWLKSRLMRAGVSLFGVQFLNAHALRRELCAGLGMLAAAHDAGTLAFLLRLRALREGASAAGAARQPEACLAALGDLAAAGWLDESGLPDDLLPTEGLRGWLADLRAAGTWAAELDSQFLARAHPLRGAEPLAVCAFGWDAGHWPLLRLLLGAVKAACTADVYVPLPRGTSQTVQQEWLTTLAGAMDSEINVCPASAFESPHTPLVERLEGADLTTGPLGRKPEFLIGLDAADATVLARGFVTRWLLEQEAAGARGTRLAILSPGRQADALALVRALGEAGIAVEDDLGEVAQPGLAIQVQRGILAYHLESGDVECLLRLIELLNEHAARWQGAAAPPLLSWLPLDPQAVGEALQAAFADRQHHSAPVLCRTAAFARSPIALALGEVIQWLEPWPEEIAWSAARDRWEKCLRDCGLDTEVLEPHWSRLAELAPEEPVPAAPFFEYLRTVLDKAAARPAPGKVQRFARVVVTTLAGAAGQSWDGALFLDSNEGAWPVFPPENPFLGDAARAALNRRRAALPDPARLARGYLPTASDRAQSEQFHFLELLENCTGAIAFAGAARDVLDPATRRYPNEWALRCLVEADRGAAGPDKLLDRWRRSVRRTRRRSPSLPRREAAHLAGIFARRRDPATAFDEYSFNFEALAAPGELPWGDPWSGRDLESAWNQPATFALAQLFGAGPLHGRGRRFQRGEAWAVGRLVHRWVGEALGAARAPRLFPPAAWSRALVAGAERARAGTEAALRAAPGTAAPAEVLSLWWESVHRQAGWGTRRCLAALAEMAAGGPVWVWPGKVLEGSIATGEGRLRLRARCDVSLLDGPGIQGAACQLLDLTTGAAPGSGQAFAGQVQQGHSLRLAAILLLALEEGAAPDGTRVGVVHPEAANGAVLSTALLPVLGPMMERLARQQCSLVFGQGHTSRHERNAECLPLATTSIDADVLEGKARLTFP